MALQRHLLSLLLVLALIGTACGSQPESLASTETSTAAGESQERVSEQAISVDANLSDDSTNSTVAETVAPDAVDETPTTAARELEEPTQDTVPVVLCFSPTDEERWVDVAIDDPDGGLNLRSGPGVSSPVLWALPQNTKVRVTNLCQTVGSTDWWKVQPIVEADIEAGWVSSNFLATEMVVDDPGFEPGLGKAVNDADNVGIDAETLDELAAKLAAAYGFDDDVVITMIGEPEVADAVGGDVTYEFTGLKDDSLNGYRLDIGFHFQKNDDATEVTGYTAVRITTQALCTRGVTDDGLCV